MEHNTNGFSEYKKLFISEFERLNENYNKLNDEVQKTNSKLSDIYTELKTIAQVTHATREQVTDQENRLRSLEKDRWKIMGGLTVIMVVVNVIIKLL